ncbi:MAG: helix-turn-helix transcriptional regulator [Thermodesulfobacteriota bacterium]|nr:helix-turn-helix transcriptional regulator [Thermodesulfobacteriota bacterium]
MSSEKIFASQKIKEIRKKQRLSQNNFGKSLGYSQGYIADVESGRTKPSRGMLEAIQRVYGTSIDWLLSENQILDLIEENKDPEVTQHIIFVYAFTQQGIDHSEEILRDVLANTKYIFVDASGIKSGYQFLKKIFNVEGTTQQLWDEQLEPMMLNEEVVLIIKNMSLSKIPDSGGLIRSIFKIMDDAREKRQEGTRSVMVRKRTKSSLIILDYPSYVEKNMMFGYYAIPIYLLSRFDDAR